MKLWVDVEDLFQYAAHIKRPSGIQRLAFEVQCALRASAPEDVYFLRHSKSGSSFITIPFAEVEALFSGLSGPASSQRPMPAAPSTAASASPGLIHSAMSALPIRVQEPARRLRLKLAEAGNAMIDLAKAIRPPPAAPAAVAIAKGPDFASQAAKGDWLVVLGSPWSDHYAAFVQTQCQRHGLHFAILMCDIIPLCRPEWADKKLRRAFATWFHSVAPLADIIFSISRHTARDIEDYAKQTGLSLRGAVHPIPLGTGFGAMPVPARTPRLPAPRSFVLIVSTIEARKNHMLAFRVWRELMETMPHDQIPTLVFAGRTGWLVQDLMQQIDNADWLNGKIHYIESPSDGELAALYQDCLFTLFPSFYEGWGLPVSESLAHGAPCLASNRTSLPEAGGHLARYFNPDNLDDALSAVRTLIENPETLRNWRKQIATDFEPVPWTDSANAILSNFNTYAGRH